MAQAFSIKFAAVYMLMLDNWADFKDNFGHRFNVEGILFCLMGALLYFPSFTAP